MTDFDGLFLTPGARAVPKVEMTSFLINGEERPWSGPMTRVLSPILLKPAETFTDIGCFPSLTAKESVECAQAASKAFDLGRGEWPSMSPRQRINVLQTFLKGVRAATKEIAELIMWEICKTEADAIKEVERSIKYAEDTIAMYKATVNKEAGFTSDGGVFAMIRRVPLGVVLTCSPFNYPFNESWAILIPALLLGNTIVLKLPRNGVLCHVPTFNLFRTLFPKGVVNVVTGSGRATLPAIMASGLIDAIGFIGTSSAAAALSAAHPKPNRLKLCLGLEAKNAGIVLGDCKGATLQTAISECVLGSFSFNGQRCTAIKIIFVHSSIADEFLAGFCAAVDKLKLGLPWEAGVGITPLCEAEKPAYMQGLVDDAIKLGAKVVNASGGRTGRSFYAPTVVAYIKKGMRLFHEEQFGPAVGVAKFDSIDEVLEAIRESNYGQQAAVFGSDPAVIGSVVDTLAHLVSRVNVMSSCMRGPDTFPFTGRKDSAQATLSVYDALRVFSIRTCVAAKEGKDNEALMNSIVRSGTSKFVNFDNIF